MGLRILAISDLRVQDIKLVERVAERTAPDLILYAGDDVARFGPGPNSWSPLAQRTRHGLAGVVGNDCLENHALAFEQPGCHNLQRTPLVIDRLAILGLQGAPADEGLPIGATLYTRRAAKAHLARQLAATGGREVLLVSHAPPYGVLDLARRFGVEHVGSTVVREMAELRRVQAIICGHVHLQGGRTEQVGRCTVVNVACHDHAGSPLRFAILEWDGKRVRVTHMGTERSSVEMPRLPGIHPRTHVRLETAGLRSPNDVVDVDDRTLVEACGTAERARRVRAIARAHRDGVPVIFDPKFAFPENVLFVDVETSLGGDDPWLIGCKKWGCGSSFRQLEELDASRHAAHLRGFQRAVARLGCDRFAQWGPFDRGAIARAHARFGHELPVWLQPSHWTDASRSWIQRVVALPVLDFSLKTVARYLGYEFAADDISGMTVGSWYSQYRRSGEAFDVGKVRTYNSDDVLALEHVVTRVRTMMRERAAFVEPRLDAPAGPRRARRTMTRERSVRSRQHTANHHVVDNGA